MTTAPDSHAPVSWDDSTPARVHGDIAVLAADGDAQRRAAELLVGALGLPQVRVATSLADVPDAAHSVVLLGSGIEMSRDPALRNRRAWSVVATGLRLSDVDHLTYPAKPDEKQAVQVPPRLLHVARPRRSRSRTDRGNACAILFDAAFRRFRKRRPRPRERADIFLCSYYLGQEDDGNAREIALGFSDLLQESRTALDTKCALVEDQLHRYLLGAEDELPSPQDCGSHVFAHMRAGDSVRSRASRDTPRFDDRVYETCPELGVGLLLFHSAAIADAVQTALDRIRADDPDAWQLTCAAAAAHSTGDTRRFQDICRQLMTAGLFRDADADFRRTRTGSTFVSPLLGAMLFLAEKESNPDFTTPFLRRQERAFTWCGWADCADHGWSAVSGSDSIKLVDAGRRRISESLFDYWVEASTPPALRGLTASLEGASYRDLGAGIEAVWLSLFQHIQSASGTPLIRVRPWPASKRAALSIRWDVDRLPAPKQIDGIAKIQHDHLQGSGGTWLLHRDAAFVGDLRAALTPHPAEIGLVDDSAAGGEPTIQLESATLVTDQVTLPRRLWMEDEPAADWAVPVAIPLSETAADTDLACFDRMRGHFLAQLESGGHAIVASHPGDNIELLAALARREQLENVWIATIGAVVERCRLLLTYDALRCRRHDGRFTLIARGSVADVRVEVLGAPCDSLRSLTLQLEAGVACDVPITNQ